jgi:uncharacterized protein
VITPLEKENELRRYLRGLNSLAVAYSGGVDSTYLLKVAVEELGERVLAVTATSSTYPERELKKAREIAIQIGARHILVESEETEIPQFKNNPPDRCYYCKKELFQKIAVIAKEQGIAYLADGSNRDDLNDYRPGMKALLELGVISPLKECGFTKQDIRERSRIHRLPTWDQPAFACLSSRFPYGTPITRDHLEKIDRAENALYQLGLRVVRVRHHGSVARLEIGSDEMPLFTDKEFRRRVINAVKNAGYTYVTLDLEGYRTGSMNEEIPRSVLTGEET